MISTWHDISLFKGLYHWLSKAQHNDSSPTNPFQGVPKSRCFGHLTIRGMDVLDFPQEASSCAWDPTRSWNSWSIMRIKKNGKSMVTWHRLNIFSILIWTENIKMRIIQYDLAITLLPFNIMIFSHVRTGDVILLSWQFPDLPVPHIFGTCCSQASQYLSGN